MLVDKFIRYSKYKGVCFDTETESLNLGLSRPWQLSYVTFDAFNEGKPKDYHLLWGDINVSKDAARVTRFKKDQYLKVAVDPKEPVEEFLKIANNEEYLIVGHNMINFDVYQLKNALDILGIEINWTSFLSRVIDTYALAKAIKLNIVPPRDMSPIERYTWQVKVLNGEKCRGLKLSDLVTGDEGKLHDAAYDILLNVQAFRNLIKQIDL